MFSVAQVQQHGLWCQIGSGNKNNGGEIDRKWYYPTLDEFMQVPSKSDDSVSYQSLTCDDQIGLVVIGNITDSQGTGIVKCSPSAADQGFYAIVYSDMVFNNYCKFSYIDINLMCLYGSIYIPS